MADSDKIFNPTPTDDLPQDGKSKGESEQHFETEQAAQALEMVHTLLNWREAHVRGVATDMNELMTVNAHADTEMRWVLDGLHPVGMRVRGDDLRVIVGCRIEIVIVVIQSRLFELSGLTWL